MFECNRLSNGAAPEKAAVQANFKLILVPKYFCSDTIVTLKQDFSPECYLTLRPEKKYCLFPVSRPTLLKEGRP